MLATVVAMSLVATCPVALAQGGGFDWSGVSPVEKLMARRAARIDALRELAELVKGLPIGGGQTIGDLQPDISVFLVGASEVGQARYMASGFCRLTMQLPSARVLAEATNLAARRGVALDTNQLRQALGATIEATGLGRPRNAPRGVKDPREGRRATPQQPRFAQRDPQPQPPSQPRATAEPQRSERKVERMLGDDRQARGSQPRGQGMDDFDRRWEAERQAWNRQGDEFNRRWREESRRWAAQQNRMQQMQIDQQWAKARPMGNGWRVTPDGTQIRLVSERTVVVPNRDTSRIVEDGRVIRRTIEVPRGTREIELRIIIR